jgi:hypothetical protein
MAKMRNFDAGFRLAGMDLDSHVISVAQLVDTTGQGIFRFRVEVATLPGLKSIPGKLAYARCGVDNEGRELYVSSWFDLRTVLREVEHLSEGLKARGKTYVVTSNVKSRVADQLL